jgi:PhnB protein
LTHSTPFLLFDGNCAEAMEFYRSCLGGELTVTRLSDTPMRDRFPPEEHERVVNAQLRGGAVDITGTDWLHPTRVPRQGNTVAVYIGEAPYRDLKGYFARLSVGADPDVLDELVDLPFGSDGHLADRFGVHWFFQGQRSP